MSLRVKIWLSILVLVLFFTLNSVVIYLEMENNKSMSEELVQKISPSLNFLHDFSRNIAERTSLVSDWVYYPNNEISKQKLIEIIALSKNTFIEIMKASENYSNQAWKDSIKNISREFSYLTAAEMHIINTLRLPNDYNDPDKKNDAIVSLTEELIPLSNELNGRINEYTSYTNKWKEDQSKAIKASSKLITQLWVLLVIEVFIFGFILWFMIEKMLIKPIIEVRNTLDNLKNGIILKKNVSRRDEIGTIQTAVNGLADRVDEMSAFALEIGKRNFDQRIKPLSEHDKLGHSLIKMCNDLKKNITRLEETKKIAGIGYIEYNPSTSEIECGENFWDLLDNEKPTAKPTLSDFLKIFSSENTLSLQIEIRNCLKHSSNINMILPAISYKNRRKIFSVSGKHFFTVDDLKGKIVIVIQDITDSKEAEGKLKIAHDQMESFFQNIDDVFFSFDTEAKQLLQISEACEKIYGYSKDNFKASFKLIEDVIVEEDKIDFQEKKLELQIGNPVVIEYRINTKSGKVKWVETKMTPSFNDSGKIIRLDGITSDISRRKENEEILNKTNADLRKSNQELDKFVYSVSHDLRAPLTSMQGIVELTDLQSAEELTGKHMKMLGKSIKKLDSFISDILNYSRNARLDVKNETVDFNELLKDISKELEFMDGADSKLVIDNTVDDNGIFYSDNNRIRIVLSNLISNSIRYKDAGKDNPFININVKADEHFARIVVEDNGIGIKKEQQDKVFNMFYRISEQSVGSGLGLYIVKETVEKLNGEISLDSKPGVGTKILVMIPNLYPHKKAS